jgi:diacylglycerol O-acyltransferase-1
MQFFDVSNVKDPENTIQDSLLNCLESFGRNKFQPKIKMESKETSPTNDETCEYLLKMVGALEKEVKRLCSELDRLTLGVEKRGYLFKFREREIYYAPKWGLRYFVLQGKKLSYFHDENENRPRRTIDLSKCFIRDEGTKKNGQFHIFGIYLSSEGDNEGDGEEQLIMRLSSDNLTDATLWIDMLEQACALSEIEIAKNPEANDKTDNEDGDIALQLSPPKPFPTISSKSTNTERSVETNSSVNEDEKYQDLDNNDWGHASLDNTLTDIDTTGVSIPVLKRVQSSSLALQESNAKLTLARRILAKRSPNDYSKSGTRLSQLSRQLSSPSKKKQDKPAPKEFPGYKPMHLSSAPSPLSNEVRPGEYSFRGFFNLSVIILALTHCDLIVNNIVKYGLKFNPVGFIRPPEAMIDVTDTGYQTSALLEHIGKAVFTWVISVVLQFVLEKYTSRHHVSERLVLTVNFILGTFNIVAPCYWVWTSKAHPGANLLYLFQSVIIWMKLISYAHANKDLRVLSRRSKKMDREASSSSVDDMAFADNNAKPFTGEQYVNTISQVKDLQPPFILYPQNLTMKNLLYFLIAPTLCYQLNYPRAPKVDFRKIVFLLARMIFVAFMILFAVEQYVKPTLDTVIAPMQARNIPAVLERLMKLSLPSTYVWLLGFYFYFHLWLNLLAEITRFGDRTFYKDWWNAKTIDRYW